MKVGKTLEVHAGTFTSETPVKPIHAREGRSGHAPGDAGRTAPGSGDDRARYFKGQRLRAKGGMAA